MPKVSVIIPVYNVKYFLNGCVSSVLGQTMPDIEVLLIDDGSTDGSGKMCDELAKTDSRIRVVHQANKGLGGARDCGLKQAQGEYIAFVDSDDALVPYALKNALQAADKCSDADVIVFGHREQIADAQGNVLAVGTDSLPVMSGEFTFKEFWQKFAELKTTFFAWSKLYRRDYIQKNGLDFASIRVGEDSWFWSGVIDTPFRHIVYLQQALYLYRIRPGSIMTSFNWEYFDRDYAQKRARFDEAVERWEPQPGIYRDIVIENRMSSLHLAMRYLSFARDTLPLNIRRAILIRFCVDPRILKGIAECERRHFQSGWQWQMVHLLKTKHFTSAVRYYDTIQTARVVRNRVREIRTKLV